MVTEAQAVLGVSVLGSGALVAFAPVHQDHRWRRAFVFLVLSMLVSVLGALLVAVESLLAEQSGSVVVGTAIVVPLVGLAAWTVLNSPEWLLCRLWDDAILWEDSERKRTGTALGVVLLALAIVVTIF